MEQIYVQTEDLSVGYHGKVLLSDIALKVKKGEILVLIGPNGAGKSTIIKNIIREMNPIGGNIYVNYKIGTPNPQFMRKNWQNLNGCWGLKLTVAEAASTADSMSVIPFCRA